MRSLCAVVGFAFPSLLLAAHASAVEPRGCTDPAGELISVEGEVSYREAGEWLPAELGQGLCDRDSVRTAASSRAAIQLADDAVLRLDASTTLVLADVAPAPQEPSFFELIAGAIQSFSRRPQTLQVDTPYVNATIEGTEFVLRVDEGKATLAVLEGTVVAVNEAGSASVESGSAIVATAGAAPEPFLFADPVDAVEWGLFYPPVVSLDGSDPIRADVERALALVAQNRTAEAVDELLSGSAEGDRIRVYAAALLLSVGQVEEARRLLEDVLGAAPGNGPALAQLAVIDIVQNRTQEALTKAEQAVAAAPDEAAPYIALSLAQQNAFRLQASLDTLLQGSERVPHSALLWARLSELWLSLGYRDRSAVAADKSLELDPEVARAYVMRGFAALTNFDTETATVAFERAIALEPADPLPHLGLGLARVREGELEAGRGQIDAAVALDATRSLLRSYLGKAYFDENRHDLALQQFRIAKELDPDDPTPYFYESILLQSENRPGEALLEVQKAIELNDNRAPFRGRLQLDQDLAARGASLGRIYEDLGFIQLGMREATVAQALDPANAAAHRFLADIYRNTRRRELARVSELSRGQLLSDPSLNIVQPSLAETNLNLVSSGGPANAAFNEYNALFLSDGIRSTLTGAFGTEDTFGGEAAVAIKDDNVSLSVGGFGFHSDGFRENFFVDHIIFDTFSQVAITPELTVLFEVRYRDTESGDLGLNFDPDDFDPSFVQGFEEGSARVGLRFAPDPHNATLATFTYADRQTFQAFDLFPGFRAQADLEGESMQGEIQHIYQRDFFSITAGGTIGDVEEVLDLSLVEPFNTLISTQDRTGSNYRGYAYTSVALPYDVIVTAGLSYDALELGLVEVDELNPKGGVQWRPHDDVLVRAAYMKTVKPPLATNRTIEPTQVAGFNQFFDDPNGTIAERWGVGIDWTVTPKIFLGGEMTWRDLEVPFFNAAGLPEFNDQKEQTHRAYLNLLPHPRVPVSVEFVYDRFEAEPSPLTDLGLYPAELETYSVPVTVRYFDPSGFFAGLRGTYVHQRVDRTDARVNPPDPTLPGLAEGTSDFFLLDADLGYRFPNQNGSVSLEVRNITDQDFRFQDDGFREFGDDPSTGPYFPGISVVGRLTLSF